MPWLNRTLAFSILLLRFIVQSVYLNVEAFAYYLPLIWSRASGLVHASFNRASCAHAFFALTYKLSRRSCSDVTVLCRSLSSMGTGHTTRHVWYKPCTNLCIVLGNSVTSVHRTLKNEKNLSENNKLWSWTILFCLLTSNWEFYFSGERDLFNISGPGKPS